MSCFLQTLSVWNWAYIQCQFDSCSHSTVHLVRILPETNGHVLRGRNSQQLKITSVFVKYSWPGRNYFYKKERKMVGEIKRIFKEAHHHTWKMTDIFIVLSFSPPSPSCRFILAAYSSYSSDLTDTFLGSF